MVKSDNFTFSVKSITDEGTFEGILPKYGNVDRVNDRVVKGAYDDTLRTMGNRRPLLFSHKQDEPVGSVELVDTEESLNVRGRLNLDVNRAREVHALMKAGDIGAMSIGYTVVDSTYDRDGVRNLTKLELLEASLVCVPANPECVITSVKSADGGNMAHKSRYSSLKVLDELDEELREKLLKELEELDETEQEEQKDCEETEEKSEEPEQNEPEDDETEPEEDEEEKSEDEDEQEQKAFDALVAQINAITSKLR